MTLESSIDRLVPAEAARTFPDVSAHAVPEAMQPCVSCGGPQADTRFCPNCGERRPADRRYHLREFLAEAFEAVTNADGTLWRSFATLLRRPGELTRAYMIGRRTPYMRPLQLFLIVNVAYFLYASLAGERVFDTPYHNHLRNSNYGPTAKALVRERLIARGMTEPTYQAVFDAAATVHAKTLIIAMVPMFALLVAALEFRRRRPVVQHVVFAVHVYTVMLLFAILQRYLIVWPIVGWHRLRGATPSGGMLDQVVGWAMMGAMAVWISLGLRRAYGDRLPWAIAKGTTLGLFLLNILLLYRVLLFYTVFYTT